LCADWVTSLWKETFEELLDEDNELDYGDQWNLNFSYVQTADVTQEEKKRGWKIYCHSGFGRYVLFLHILKVTIYITLNSFRLRR